jgi:hypothetical protein
MRHRASKIRKFSYRSRVTGIEYENRQNVTKSLKITQKIEISAYMVARRGVARAVIVGSGTNLMIPRLRLSSLSLRSTVSPSGFWPNCYTTLI